MPDYEAVPGVLVRFPAFSRSEGPSISELTTMCHRAGKQGEEIHLTPKEFDMLHPTELCRVLKVYEIET